MLLAPEAAKNTVSLLPFGQHYYAGRGVPEFNLGDMGYFRGRASEQVPAPAGAAGSKGAVTWAHLRSTPGGRKANQRFKEVFRVATAGGLAPAGRGRCNPRGTEKQTVLHVPYEAEYWLYV